MLPMIPEAENDAPEGGSPAMESLIHTATSVADSVLFKAGMGNCTDHCSGIILLTASEAALGLSGQCGSGLLLQHFRNTNTWSLPVAIRMAGTRFGVQLGAQTKAMVILLNDNQLRTFSDHAVARIGSQCGFSVSKGLEGDAHLDISDFCICVNSAFAETKGWKFCISLQGNVVSPIGKLNKEMHGDMCDPNSSMTIAE